MKYSKYYPTRDSYFWKADKKHWPKLFYEYYILPWFKKIDYIHAPDGNNHYFYRWQFNKSKRGIIS